MANSALYHSTGNPNMSDTRIEDAIKQAVQEAGETPELASKMLAWLDGLTSGNETIENIDRSKQRVRTLYDTASTKHVETSGADILND